MLKDLITTYCSIFWVPLNVHCCFVYLVLLNFSSTTVQCLEYYLLCNILGTPWCSLFFCTTYYSMFCGPLTVWYLEYHLLLNMLSTTYKYFEYHLVLTVLCTTYCSMFWVPLIVQRFEYHILFNMLRTTYCSMFWLPYIVQCLDYHWMFTFLSIPYFLMFSVPPNVRYLLWVLSTV